MEDGFFGLWFRLLVKFISCIYYSGLFHESGKELAESVVYGILFDTSFCHFNLFRGNRINCF